MDNKKSLEKKARVSNAVESFLKAEGLKYEVQDEGEAFKLEFPLRSRAKKTTISIIVYETHAMFFAALPVSGEYKNKRMMLKLAEYITRVNFNMIKGSFKMDFEDGQIGFETDLDCTREMPAQDQFSAYLFMCINHLNQYSDGILSVIFCDSDPKQAIEQSNETYERQLKEWFFDDDEDSDDEDDDNEDDDWDYDIDEDEDDDWDYDIDEDEDEDEYDPEQLQKKVDAKFEALFGNGSLGTNGSSEEE